MPLGSIRKAAPPVLSREAMNKRSKIVGSENVQSHAPMTRYFRDTEFPRTIWKFTPGERAQIRLATDPKWDHSIFETVEAFLADPGESVEITVNEAED